LSTCKFPKNILCFYDFFTTATKRSKKPLLRRLLRSHIHVQRLRFLQNKAASIGLRNLGGLMT